MEEIFARRFETSVAHAPFAVARCPPKNFPRRWREFSALKP
jgi:hypothetical protein